MLKTTGEAHNHSKLSFFTWKPILRHTDMKKLVNNCKNMYSKNKCRATNFRIDWHPFDPQVPVHFGLLVSKQIPQQEGSSTQRLDACNSCIFSCKSRRLPLRCGLKWGSIWVMNPPRSNSCVFMQTSLANRANLMLQLELNWPNLSRPR